MIPLQKAPAIDSFLTKVFGHDRKAIIVSDKCVPPPIGCGGDATNFKDAISRKEYSISGLCQECQDRIF